MASSLPPPPTAPARRRRRWAIGLALVTMLSLALLLTSVAFFAWVLRAWIDPAAIAPWAAEPTVIAVVDGDTVVVRLGRERVPVRLLGIDTPRPRIRADRCSVSVGRRPITRRRSSLPEPCCDSSTISRHTTPTVGCWPMRGEPPTDCS